MPVTMTTQFGAEGHEQQIFFFESRLIRLPRRHGRRGGGVAGDSSRLTGRDGEESRGDAALPSTLTAVGSVKDLALNVAPDKVDEYREKLVAKGIDVSEVRFQTMDENCRPIPIADRSSPAIFMKSIYFHDPNGIQLEFACWTRAMTEPRPRSRHSGRRAGLRWCPRRRHCRKVRTTTPTKGLQA